MKTLRNAAIALLTVGTLAGATTASALPANWNDLLPAWTATASSCAIDESSASKYEVTGTQFRFLGDNVSNYGIFSGNAARQSLNPISIVPSYQPITVRCNVTPVYDYVPAVPAAPGDLFGTPASWVSADWNSLIVGYKDTDGISAKAQVSASLRKISRATMTESTIATFSSNLSATVAANEDVKQFTHKFDFSANDYYVEINLIRQDTSVTTPVAYSVRLAKGNIGAILH
jgi:hypothetical protein